MENILVIDDEPGIVEILSEVLEGAGYNVTALTQPSKALEAIEQQHFDIVITDLKMPEIDGIQVVKAAKKASGETEVIVITGYASLESAIEALKQNVFDYLLKPLNVSGILLTVKKVAERIQMRRTNQSLHKRVERALADLTILHSITKIINSSEEVKDVLGFAADTIETSFEMDKVAFMLYDEKTEEFYIERSIGFSQYTNEHFRIKLDEGIIGQAIRPNETVNIAGFEKDKRFEKYVDNADKKGIDYFITVPLNAQEHIIGLITIHQLNDKNAEDLEKLKFIEVMSVSIAPMVLLGQFTTEKKLSLKDSLYGAKNELLNIIKKAKELRGTLSILMFKLYLKNKQNDELRIFDVGNAVYNHIANNISPIDSAVKIGFDSFMVILQGKTKILTEELAGKIKKQAESDEILRSNGFLLDYGYADFPMDGLTFESLLNKAQASLWEIVKN